MSKDRHYLFDANYTIVKATDDEVHWYKPKEDLFVEVRFKQAKDWVDEYVEIHYDPIGWQLQSPDAKLIVPMFQQEFETDFSVHCDEEGQEYSTSYDSIRDFLSQEDLEGKLINRISCIIPIRGENYSVTIDFKENTLYVLWNKHEIDGKLSSFDPAIQKISCFLSQSKEDGSYSFHKRIKNWKQEHHRSTTIEYIFHPAHREKHDMIVLRFFDQRYHLGTIYTEVWDQERHFWRIFDGFKQYLEEAQTDSDGFYEFLDEISFNLFIDEIRYRVWIYLDDRLSLSRIEIEYEDTDHTYDFTPVMEELESLIVSDHLI